MFSFWTEAPPNQRSQSRMELVVFEKKATQKPLEQPKWNDGFDAEGRQLQMSFFADCLGFPATQMSQISSQAHQHPVHEDMGCGTSQTCKVSESNSQVFRFSAIGAAAVIRSEIAAQMEHIKSTPG